MSFDLLDKNFSRITDNKNVFVQRRQFTKLQIHFTKNKRILFSQVTICYAIMLHIHNMDHNKI